MSSPAVLISEVGPRDGLQSVPTIMPTDAKLRWIGALFAAGLREIEVASFVPARLLPQMADAADVVARARALPGFTVMALVPNVRGAEAAIAAGAHKLTIPVSASAAHSLANVRKTREQMIDEVQRIVELRNERAPHVHIEAGIATAFGCTLQGAVDEDDNRAGAAHMHNTRGLGLANCLAAYEAGVSTFDASQGGLGGCPYAPGASGNVVTEDLVFMFESMGVSTGIDLEALIAAREWLKAGLPDVAIYGMTPEAGLTVGFRYADGRPPRIAAAPLRAESQ